MSHAHSRCSSTRPYRRVAAAYSLALLPVEAVFWIGFALPFGPPLGIARVVLAFLA